MSEMCLIDSWDLTRAQARILLSLYRASDNFRDIVALRQLSGRGVAASSEGSIRILVHHLRMKLRPHDVDIVTRPGGYALTEASIAIIHSALQGDTLAVKAIAS